MVDGRRRARWLGANAAAAVVLAAGAVWAGATWLGGGSHRAAPHLAIDQSGRLRAFDVRYRDLVGDHTELARRVVIRYRAWNGQIREADVVLPDWYTASTAPALPLVISPHGRGISPADNLHFWGGLPAFGPFIVISPAGAGRKLTLYSWGWHRQVDDLARMPAILRAKLPWVKIDRRRIYAVGSSMGGQETLMLVARYPGMLAGATALDSATDMAARYRNFPQIAGGLHLQALAREEIGGTPANVPHAYALRSPIHWADEIARSGVPLHIWWSRRDRIVIDQYHESGGLFRTVAALHPRASVTQYVGNWAHSQEFHASARLPLALVELDLIRLSEPIPTPDEVDRTK